MLRGQRKIDLTVKREFALLEYLMRNAGVTRHPHYDHRACVDLNFDSGTNVVDVYINYLRSKVDTEGCCALIHTVRGIGYELNDSLFKSHEAAG